MSEPQADYDEVEQELHTTNEVDFNEKSAKLDTLFNKHAKSTDNTAVIEADHKVFKLFHEEVVGQIAAKSNGGIGEFTVDKLLNGMRVGVLSNGENVNKFISLMGLEMFQNSSLAPQHEHEFPVNLTNKIVEIQPTKQVRREVRPTSNSVLPTTNELNVGLNETSDHRQLELQNLVLQTVKNAENMVLLDRLCFDPDFARCIENYFLVCTLVKEHKLMVNVVDGRPVISLSSENGNHIRRQINVTLDFDRHRRMMNEFEGVMIERQQLRTNYERSE